MVDQELDALLVGALYGELGPAEEARLAAHLESHPTDRTALDDLRSTRKALVDARFFELWFDPPPAVSARLVQEAARRAPRAAESGDGWFMRLARSLAAHPAMAAAAMLVVVVGVAGTLYMQKGADMAAPTSSMVAERDVAPAAAPAPAPAAGSAADSPPVVAVTTPVPGSENGFRADLADGKEGRVQKASTNDVPARPSGIVVAHHEAMPKDLDKNAEEATTGGEVASTTTATAGDLKQGFAKPAAQTPPAAPPAPPPPPSTVAAIGGAAGGGPAAANAKDQHPQEGQDAWARDQHARVASLVQGGHCQDAAPLAAEIKTRAPAYYADHVATDRSIKSCMAYIARAVEKQEADRAKSEATKASAAKATDSTK